MKNKTLPAGRQAKISVIMSVYNGMPFLKEATESILKQTYKNFEYIIVDDASTDDTWRYLKSLRDKRIKLVKNKKNLGLAASLNIAIQQTKGEFIARMDADDISLKNRLATQLKFLENNSDVSICGSWADLIDEKGKNVGEKRYPTNDQTIKKALMWYQPIIHPTWFCKLDVFNNLNGYDPKFDLAEDYQFLIRASREYKIANIPKKLLLLRLHHSRRSQAEIHEMDKIDLKVKIFALNNGYFDKFYTIIILKKFLMTFLFPASIKLWLAKKLKLA